MQIHRNPVERVSPWAMVCGGDQAEGTVPAEQIERAAEEVRNLIGVAVAPGMNLLEPVGVAGDVGRRHRVLARERRVANDRVESRIVPLEDLRKLDLPMERCEQRLGAPQLRAPTSVAVRLAAHDRIGELRAQCLALLRFGLLEERGQNEIAEGTGLLQLVAGVAPPQTPFLV